MRNLTIASIKFTLLAAGVALGAFISSADAATCLTSDIAGPGGVSVSSCAATLRENPGLDVGTTSGVSSQSFNGMSQLFGDTLIGIHWIDSDASHSAIYKLDLSSPTDFINIIRGHPGGTSDVLLFPASPFGGGVLEPVIWAMMILGFGAVAATMRHRRAGGALA